MITKIRGTQDILDTQLHTFALNTITEHLQNGSYQLIVLPILESTDLFKRSLGNETDIISKELFIASSSSAAEKSSETICLRPEGTAQTVRAFIEGNITQLPWKVFSYGPMFRYERPQKGRYRQFTQINLECIGSSSITQDAQVIALFDELFSKKFKIEEYALHLNFLGTPEERIIYKEQLKNFLDNQTTLCANCITRKETNILRTLDCKNAECQTVYQNAPHLIDSCKEASLEEWKTLQNYLQLLGISFIYNPRLVRGLDYYNKTVFEFVSPLLGAQTAFCGGGRYDNLVQEISQKQDQPSIGAAIGLERLLLILEATKERLSLPIKKETIAIIPVEKEQHALSLLIAQTLQRSNICADLLCDGSLKSMIKKADKMNATYAVVIGQTEQEAGTVQVKHLATSSSVTIKQTELIAFLKR